MYLYCRVLIDVFGYLTGQVRIHVASYGFRAQPVSQEKHQLGDGTLGRTVVSADDPCLQELKPGAIAFLQLPRVG